MLTRPLKHSDEEWKRSTLVHGRGTTSVAHLGELVDAASLSGLVAMDQDARVGVVTCAERGSEMEVVTIGSPRPSQGSVRH